MILMCKDTEVATFHYNTHYEVDLQSIEIKQLHALPIIYREEGRSEIHLKKWLDTRCMPDYRKQAKQIKRSFGCVFIQEIIIKGHGVSILDNYWIKRENEQIQWKDVNAFSNPINKNNELVKYLGNAHPDHILKEYNPAFVLSNKENIAASIASSENVKIVNGIYVFEDIEYLVSNYLMSNIFTQIFDITSAKFEIQSFVSKKTEKEIIYGFHYNFLANPNIIHITADMLINTGERNLKMSQLDYLRKRCADLKIKGSEKYIDTLLCIDFICNNTERSFKDIGFLYDTNKHEFVGFAPLYLQGYALFHKDTIINNSEKYSKLTHLPIYKNLLLIKKIENITINEKALSEFVFTMNKMYKEYHLDTLPAKCVKENIEALPKAFEYIIENKANKYRQMEQTLSNIRME